MRATDGICVECSVRGPAPELTVLGLFATLSAAKRALRAALFETQPGCISHYRRNWVGRAEESPAAPARRLSDDDAASSGGSSTRDESYEASGEQSLSEADGAAAALCGGDVDGDGGESAGGASEIVVIGGDGETAEAEEDARAAEADAALRLEEACHSDVAALLAGKDGAESAFCFEGTGADRASTSLAWREDWREDGGGGRVEIAWRCHDESAGWLFFKRPAALSVAVFTISRETVMAV